MQILSLVKERVCPNLTKLFHGGKVLGALLSTMWIHTNPIEEFSHSIFSTRGFLFNERHVFPILVVLFYSNLYFPNHDSFVFTFEKKDYTVTAAELS